jgi:hypothetical protein
MLYATTRSSVDRTLLSAQIGENLVDLREAGSLRDQLSKTRTGIRRSQVGSAMVEKHAAIREAHESAVKLAGKEATPDEETRHQRNEDERPHGQPSGQPSRHESAPKEKPGSILLFNCFRTGFELTHGDVATLPENKEFVLRSVVGRHRVGRIKSATTKGVPFKERIEFDNEWRVGDKYGLMHDGLQGDGALDVILEWQVLETKKEVALLRLDPWLSYGCSEGARLMIRQVSTA